MQALYSWSGAGPSNASGTTESPVWLLGCRYHHCSTQGTADENLPAFLQDLHSRLCLTYRRDFPAIGSSFYTSDAGWGCMLRTTQMLLAQALLFCQLGRAWRLPESSSAIPDRYYQLLQLFEDQPRAPFSVHRIAIQGQHLDKQIGQWLGPNTASTALKHLIYLHAPNLRCYVSDDGIVYTDQLLQLSGEERTPSPTTLDYSSMLLEPMAAYDGGHWKPTLILIPLRLGLDSLNEIYYHSICEIFEYPQCVGIIGGKPRASYYFIGCQEDYLLYLDPHDIHAAVDMQSIPFAHQSFHCSTLRKLHLSELDPSMALGFLCKTRDDYDDFFRRAQQSSTVASAVSIVNVAACSPSYQRSTQTADTASLDDDINSFVVL